MAKLTGAIKSVFLDIKNHWSKPKEGEYVPYKEFATFLVGASGNNAFQGLVNYMTFAVGCLLVGTIYGISFLHISIIGIIGMPFTFLFNPMYMIIQDNLGELEGRTKITIHSLCIPLLLLGFGCYFIPQHYFEQFVPALPQIIGTILCTSVFNVYYKIFTYKLLSKRFGKFICWVISGCIPALVMFMLILFLPFNDMLYYNKLWTLHLCFWMFNIFLVFIQQIGNIQNVLSPNTGERAKLMSIGTTIFSLVPSLLSMFLPALMQLKKGFTNLEAYRLIFPIMGVIFAAMTLLMAFSVKERIIVEKNHKAKVPFFNGFKAVIKNKYYWIQNLSNLPNLFVVGAVAVVNVIFIYVSRQEWLMGVYAGIIGTACVPGMLLAPWLIKKFGKRKLVITSRALQLVCNIAVTFSAVIGSIPLFIIFNFISTFAGSPLIVVQGAMTADIWDYQQYKTGERLDGCSGIFGLLMTPLATLGAFVIPLVYEGLHFTTDWDIMFVPKLRNPILWIGLIMGTVAGILALIPWFFYDLTEKKHHAMMEELTHRTFIANGGTEEEYEETHNAAAKELAIEGVSADIVDEGENITIDSSNYTQDATTNDAQIGVDTTETTTTKELPPSTDDDTK